MSRAGASTYVGTLALGFDSRLRGLQRYALSAWLFVTALSHERVTKCTDCEFLSYYYSLPAANVGVLIVG